MINPLKPNYDQLHEMYVSKVQKELEYERISNNF